MSKHSGAVAVSNTGQAEPYILAGSPVTVTRSGKPVALILPFRRTMSDEEEAQLLAPHADRLAQEAQALLDEQDEPV